MGARRVEGSRIESVVGLLVLIGITALLELLIVRWMGVGSPSYLSLWIGGFSIQIDPFTHLIPLGVFVVQFSSWLHVRKELRRLPRRVGVSRGAKRAKRRAKVKVRRFFDLRAAFILVFSALSIFMFVSFILYFRALFSFVGRLYHESTLFSLYIGFVSAIVRAIRASPLSHVMDFMNSLAVKLYYALLPCSRGICGLDPVFKYVLLQYLVAFVPALVSLSYTRRVAVRRAS